jgi:hypothetical protein
MNDRAEIFRPFFFRAPDGPRTSAKGYASMARETLGIMITKYDNLDHIAGVAKAARAAGHPVMIFMTDEGVRFARDPKFLELLKVDNVVLSVCEHSCELAGFHEKTEGIIYGSQYNNATMLHDSARILVF